MARKATRSTGKKLGRPKGSGAKKSSSGLASEFAKMAFDAQEQVLSQLASLYENAKKSRAAELIAELSKLGISTGKKRGRPAKSASPRKTRQGGSVAPRYRSKQDPSMTWAGRGMMPKWMKAEMKGTKLSKEDFAI